MIKNELTICRTESYGELPGDRTLNLENRMIPNVEHARAEMLKVLGDFPTEIKRSLESR